MTTVWAYKKLEELNDATGFVAVDNEIGARLISTGEVQNPVIGAKFLKFIDKTPREVVVKPAKEEKKAKPAKAKKVKKTPTKVKDESKND